MSGRKQPSKRDQRRRSFGQNFLVDQGLIAAFIAELGIAADELVVDIGAGNGALTFPLARAGARVWAVERDRIWSARLDDMSRRSGVDDRVRIIRSDVRRLRFPKEPFRVVSNPPFNLTTDLLHLLLDHPMGTRMSRADLILQQEVTRKHAAQPPSTLTTAGWTPWWRFSAGRRIDSTAFRPRPSVDAAVLTVRRREPPVLPTWLAPGFTDLLRPSWQPPQ